MRLLPVSHRPQQQASDCLAACTAMVLDYWQIPYDYRTILRLLRTQEAGAALSNVRLIARLGVHVELRSGTLADLRARLQQGISSTSCDSTRFAASMR